MNEQSPRRRRRRREDGVFRRREQAIVEQTRERVDRSAARAALHAVSRIRDNALLDQLVALGITADTLAALSLVPLVEIAWADGRVEQAERRAILTAARAVGLDDASPGWRLVEHALSTPPGPALQSLWREYIRCACATLSPQERMALKAEMLQRAMVVAEAAGGVLGRASSVSSTEAAVLSELDRAFDLLSWTARPGPPTAPDAARRSS